VSESKGKCVQCVVAKGIQFFLCGGGVLIFLAGLAMSVGITAQKILKSNCLYIVVYLSKFVAFMFVVNSSV